MEATNHTFTALGVESSCDDTAAAVVRRMADGSVRILSNVVRGQTAHHAGYGGVVPEIAARAHVESIDTVMTEALAAAGLRFSDIDLIGATAGPGLIGGVMVGLTAAKATAIAHDKPLAPINHLEAHALSVRMTETAAFPYLLLLVSGGHTQLVAVDGVGRYRRLGTTIDDAAGEAFDKSAQLLGLGQPGGPKIEAAAKSGVGGRYDLPRPLARRDDCDFSFSGLKTALRLAADAITQPTRQDASDLALALQDAIAEHLADRTGRAMATFQAASERPVLVVAGGVAANAAIRARLSALTERHRWGLVVPPLQYCTDNGAMIAWAAIERWEAGLVPPQSEALAFAPRARWPLAEPTPGKSLGSGKRGPKA
jgi:N6-L-threonylcarbamoyladenine synthase